MIDEVMTRGVTEIDFEIWNTEYVNSFPRKYHHKYRQNSFYYKISTVKEIIIYKKKLKHGKHEVKYKWEVRVTIKNGTERHNN